VVHIVGVPSTKLQAHHALLHHTLGDGRFDAFTKIANCITATQALLTSPSQATSEIDRILRVALRECRPVYLTLPTDLVDVKVDAAPLEKDLRAAEEKLVEERMEEEKVVNHVVNAIKELYEKSTRPIVLVDACTIRFKIEPMVLELIEATGMPVFTTPMGKTAISEHHPLFSGLYVGDITVPGVKERVETSDLVISIGAILSDFNTGSFSYHIDSATRVSLHSFSTSISYAEFPTLGFRQLLPALTTALAASPRKKFPTPAPEHVLDTPAGATGSGDHMVTQDEFWPLWGRFLGKGDVVLGETGTSSFGLMDVRFPEGSRFLSQVLWGSIGWTAGACLGAAQAAAEQGRRTVLFIGDGSLQLTVQEISTMIRVGVKPIIVVLDNEGYAIERFIHGMKRGYNDIAPWKWTSILSLFASPQSPPYQSYSCDTRAELEALLKNPDFAKADKIQLVAVKLPKEDAPRALKMQAELTSKANMD
jgi:pyruvate decarboxylase